MTISSALKSEVHASSRIRRGRILLHILLKIVYKLCEMCICISKVATRDLKGTKMDTFMKLIKSIFLLQQYRYLFNPYTELQKVNMIYLTMSNYFHFLVMKRSTNNCTDMCTHIMEIANTTFESCIHFSFITFVTHLISNRNYSKSRNIYVIIIQFSTIDYGLWTHCYFISAFTDFQ